MAPVCIAVAGKGGTGKTTLSGMLVDYLSRQHSQPVLAVDADPNSNLNQVLGVDVETTLGDIRESMLGKETDGALPGGMNKQEYAEHMFSAALTEGERNDLLVMGRTQGKGCYCYVNGVLKTQIDKHATNYSYVVVDNEAGMEHISRGVLPKVDLLLLVSDCSRRGIQAVGRIAKMVDELSLKPGRVKLIVNRAPGGELDPGVVEEIALNKLDLAGVVPQDETIYRYDCAGKPTASVPEDSPVKLALHGILHQLEL